MNSLLKLCIFLMIFNLGACTTAIQKEQKLSNQQCQDHCRDLYEVCKNECVNHCAHCTALADESAECRYDKFVKEKEIQGGIIDRELNSYRDPLQCRKTTCNCSADLNVCEQACTGEIQKQLRAKPYCT